MNNQEFMVEFPPLTEKEVKEFLILHDQWIEQLRSDAGQSVIHEPQVDMELFFAEEELSQIEVDGGVMFSVERLKYLQSEEHKEMYKDASQFERDLVRDEVQWEQQNVISAGPRILFLNGKIEGIKACRKSSI